MATINAAIFYFLLAWAFDNRNSNEVMDIDIDDEEGIRSTKVSKKESREVR